MTTIKSAPNSHYASFIRRFASIVEMSFVFFFFFLCVLECVANCNERCFSSVVLLGSRERVECEHWEMKCRKCFLCFFFTFRLVSFLSSTALFVFHFIACHFLASIRKWLYFFLCSVLFFSHRRSFHLIYIFFSFCERISHVFRCCFVLSNNVHLHANKSRIHSNRKQSAVLSVSAEKGAFTGQLWHQHRTLYTFCYAILRLMISILGHSQYKHIECACFFVVSFRYF